MFSPDISDSPPPSMLDEWGSVPRRGECWIVLFATMSRLPLGPTQPLLQWVLGTCTLEHEGGHSSQIYLYLFMGSVFSSYMSYILVALIL
jgi:hypothetical protein